MLEFNHGQTEKFFFALSHRRLKYEVLFPKSEKELKIVNYLVWTPRRRIYLSIV